MTTKTVKLIAFIILLVHGIGHFQGVVASLGIKINNSNNNCTSWLLKGLGENSNSKICLVLFLITGVAGILTALSFKGILIPDYWQIIAVITAISSTICLILFPNGFAMFFNKIGAVAVNLVIYYSIVFSNNWPSVLFED